MLPTGYTWYYFCILSWEFKAHGLGSFLCDKFHVVSFPEKSLPVRRGKGGSPFFLCFLAVPGQATGQLSLKLARQMGSCQTHGSAIQIDGS